MPNTNYKFDELDIELLKEARHDIYRIRNYNDGVPNSRRVVKRLETILHKIDDLLEIGGSNDGHS